MRQAERSACHDDAFVAFWRLRSMLRRDTGAVATTCFAAQDRGTHENEGLPVLLPTPLELMRTTE